MDDTHFEEIVTINISDLFQKVGAPLKNKRWSWGAVSLKGYVFLRVWSDERRQIDDKLTVRVTHHSVFSDEPENLGYKERLEHVALIAGGARSFCVQCTAKDPNAHPRQLDSFDSRRLFVGGSLIQHGEDSWLELAQPININELMQL